MRFFALSITKSLDRSRRWRSGNSRASAISILRRRGRAGQLLLVQVFTSFRFAFLIFTAGKSLRTWSAHSTGQTEPRTRSSPRRRGFKSALLVDDSEEVLNDIVARQMCAGNREDRRRRAQAGVMKTRYRCTCPVCRSNDTIRSANWCQQPRVLRRQVADASNSNEDTSVPAASSQPVGSRIHAPGAQLHHNKWKPKPIFISGAHLALKRMLRRIVLKCTNRP